MKIALVFAVVLVFSSTAFAIPLTFTAVLNGPSESPPTSSLGTGFATVVIDSAAHTMFVSASFSGLTSNTAAAHIHCCTPAPFSGTAGVTTTVPAFPGFPLGVTAGSFSVTMDMTSAASYNPAFLTAQGGSTAAAEAFLFSGITTGNAYFNIHTTTNPGGEIRGFLTPAPEPATVFLLASGLIGVAAASRKRRTS